jgi:hypothetical protein
MADDDLKIWNGTQLSTTSPVAWLSGIVEGRIVPNHIAIMSLTREDVVKAYLMAVGTPPSPPQVTGFGTQSETETDNSSSTGVNSGAQQSSSDQSSESADWGALASAQQAQYAQTFEQWSAMAALVKAEAEAIFPGVFGSNPVQATMPVSSQPDAPVRSEPVQNPIAPSPSPKRPEQTAPVEKAKPIAQVEKHEVEKHEVETHKPEEKHKSEYKHETRASH